MRYLKCINNTGVETTLTLNKIYKEENASYPTNTDIYSVMCDDMESRNIVSCNNEIFIDITEKIITEKKVELIMEDLE